MLEQALADPAQPRLVFQPIVDLARARVAGYECLARFQGPFPAPPDEWFRQAHLHGCAEELEARVIRKALAARVQVPRPRFLTVNVTPSLLAAGPVREAFAAGGNLTGIVVELTEHVAYDMASGLADTLAELRSAGALVAMDDAGSGNAGLGQLLGVRPQLVKLDRSLVADLDVDPAKAATLRQFGALAGSLDAWVLAEGIERLAELEACIALGVPLAQGYLLGRPADVFAELPDDLAARVLLANRRAATPAIVDAAVRTVEPLQEGEEPEVWDGMRVRVDARGVPSELLIPLRRSSDRLGHRRVTDLLLVHAGTPLVDVARRAMARPEAVRLDPLVCVDDTGRLLGIVGIDGLTNALTDQVEECHHRKEDLS